MEKKWTYKDAGVNVSAGAEAVRLIKGYTEKTKIPGVLGGLGGFGGMFQIPPGYSNPVLISGADGVGTKLKLAFALNYHETVGQDCVAMCVNDIVCHGAKPLFFLDYIGTGVLEPEKIAQIVKGISDGCVLADCALIGGETAELPGLYSQGEYDLAGFAVGIAEKTRIISGADIAPGDPLIAIASKGVHSNGFSLIHKIVEYNGLDYNQYIPEFDKTLGAELMTPTKIYSSLILRLMESFEIKGAAHITGGGWYENIPRIFQKSGLKAVVSKSKVEIPSIFQLIQKWGNIDEDEMYRTFNMGAGFVLCVNNGDAKRILSKICELGETAFLFGTVEAGEECITIV